MTAIGSATKRPTGTSRVRRRASGGPGAARRLPGWVRQLVLPALPLLLLLLVWWISTEYVLQRERIYPSPMNVVDELVRIFSNEGPIGSPYGHALATLARLAVAWTTAFVAGTLLGVLAGRIRWVFDFLNAYVWIAMVVPSVVWVFVFLIVFGISNIVPVTALLVLLGAPVFIGTAEGVRATSTELIEMADSYKATRAQRLFGLYLPSIVPYMAANARVSFALGIKVVIIAEVVGLPDGIGLLVRYWSDSLYMAPVVAWGLILITVGLVADRLVFVPLERWGRRGVGVTVTTASVQER